MSFIMNPTFQDLFVQPFVKTLPIVNRFTDIDKYQKWFRLSILGANLTFYSVIVGYIIFGSLAINDRMIICLLCTFSIYYSFKIFGALDLGISRLIKYYNLKMFANTFINNMIEAINARQGITTQTPEERLIYLYNLLNSRHQGFQNVPHFPPNTPVLERMETLGINLRQSMQRVAWEQIVTPVIQSQDASVFNYDGNPPEDSITHELITQPYAYTLDDCDNEFISFETIKKLYEPSSIWSSSQRGRNPFTNLLLTRVTKWSLVRNS